MTGDVVFQTAEDQPVLWLAAGGSAPAPITAAPDPNGVRRLVLLNTAVTEAGPVVLVADGSATGLATDEGTDIVAVDPQRAELESVLVEDAATAWEGGVQLAAATDGWVIYHHTVSTFGSLVAVDRRDGSRTVLREVDHEEGAVDFAGLQLLPAAGPATAVLLIYNRAGFPDEPSAQLELIGMDGAVQDSVAVPGISWATGLPWSLSANDRFVVVNRHAEQGGPVAAIVYDLEERRRQELDRPGVVALAALPAGPPA